VRNTNPSDLHVVLLRTLAKMRLAGGVTFSRLHSGRHGLTAPLLELAAVRHYAVAHNVALESSAIAVIGECVPELPVSDRVVVDATLGLGLFADEYARFGISRLAVRQLSDAQVSKRRRALLDDWHRLHGALADDIGTLPIVGAPSERVLQSTTELAALEALARQLARIFHRRAEFGWAGVGVARWVGFLQLGVTGCRVSSRLTPVPAGWVLGCGWAG
jgi:ribokinase